jgi:hypothetical protein
MFIRMGGNFPSIYLTEYIFVLIKIYSGFHFAPPPVRHQSKLWREESTLLHTIPLK